MARVALVSDFQDKKSLEETLKNFTDLTDYLVEQKADAIVGAGDWADLHLTANLANSDEQTAQQVQHIAFYLAQQNSDKDIEGKRQEMEELLQKYGGPENLKEEQIEAEDKDRLQSLNQELGQEISQYEQSALIAYHAYYLAPETYRQQEEVLKKIREKGINVYGIIGNNDTTSIEDTLTSVEFLGNQDHVDINGTKLLGINHTNYGSENIMGEMGVKPEDRASLEDNPLYEKLNKNNPYFITTHTPPNQTNDYENKIDGEKTIGLETYIEEWSSTETPLVVHSGHSGKNGVYFYKSQKGGHVICINTNNAGEEWAYALTDFEGDKIKKIEFYRTGETHASQQESYTKAV